MPLTPKSEIIEPKKTYDKLWVSRVIISSPTVGGESNAQVVLTPYNSSTGAISDQIKVIEIENIKDKISKGNSNLLNAMIGILASAQQVINEENS